MESATINPKANNCMKKLLITIACVATSLTTMAQQRPLWLRYSAISPDGKTIVFSYKGDLFTVPTTGGVARQLTTNPAYDAYPVWSPDGSKIAFASAREGSLDVYVVGQYGGEPTRLTTNSGSELPLAFKDNDHVLFSTNAMPSAQSNIFASAKFPQIYEVGLHGGRPRMFSAIAMAALSINQQTGDLLYQDMKGSEDAFRKHHQSPICRDIWLLSKGAYTKLTDFGGEDRNPVWKADGSGFYYLSEKDGTSNIYCRSVDGKQEQQITRHQKNPVRYLTAANDGTLCYSYDGEIYTVRAGSEPQRVAVTIVSDRADRDLIRQVRTTGATEISVSPKNKEIAFVLHGDVYVTSTEYKTTKRITDTPEQERSISFSPDGRSIAYASERGGCWNIYQTTIKNKDEKQFTYATDLKEEQLTNQNKTSFQPQYSPDGKEIAYFEDRGTIRIINLASKQIRTVMDGKFVFSYSDGDIDFAWSPDSKWLLASYIGDGGYHHTDIALLDASGKEQPFNLTNSAYNDDNGKWVIGGKAMLFRSDREGYKNHGGHGVERDYFLMFFDIDAYERFLMTKEEKALLDEANNPKKPEKSEASAKSGKSEKAAKAPTSVPVLSLDLENCRKRVVRVTANSSSLGDAVMTAKGDTLYYQAAFEGGYDLWKHDLLEGKTEIVLKDIGRGYLDTDEKMKELYLIGKGGIKKIDLAKGKPSNIDFEAIFNYRPYKERENLYDHIWRQVKDKFYRTDIHGVDWEEYREIYAKFLPYINNEYDFGEMLCELLGELNASHTGARYRPTAPSQTAELGAFFDESYEGDGLKIAEIVYGGPLSIRKTGIKAGDIIERIDGITIKKGEDYFPLLEGKANRPVRLTVGGKEITVKPITKSKLSDLLYDRWVERNRQMVDSLSGGRVAYVHIASMNGDCFRKLYNELLNEDNRNRDAVIVDERHNGGGYLHDDLCHLLSGRQHSHFLAHGKYLGVEPSAQWIGPSCVLICEDDYSNACGFPREYQDLQIGKLIGTPVAGTASSVWWETLVNGITFGIPQVGRIDMRGDYGENTLLKPEIIVYNTPEDYLSGRDRQLERAVEEMLKEADAFKQKHKDEFGGRPR